jgi:hypothetical protein|eukprot:COSAG01_NODE_3830_length_5651_cov_62.375180_3_plen_229_part_00
MPGATSHPVRHPSCGGAGWPISRFSASIARSSKCGCVLSAVCLAARGRGGPARPALLLSSSLLAIAASSLLQKSRRGGGGGALPDAALLPPPLQQPRNVPCLAKPTNSWPAAAAVRSAARVYLRRDNCNLFCACSRYAVVLALPIDIVATHAPLRCGLLCMGGQLQGLQPSQASQAAAQQQPPTPPPSTARSDRRHCCSGNRGHFLACWCADGAEHRPCRTLRQNCKC